MPVVSACRSPRRRSAASASTTSSASWWPGTTTRPSTSPANTEVRRRRSRRSTARTSVTSRPDGGRLHLALPVEGHGREGRARSTVADVKAAAGGVTLRRARGHGHGQRREPPHLQDRAHRQDRARRPDHTELVVGRADRARPVPQELRLGQQPQQLARRATTRASARSGPSARHGAPAGTPAGASTVRKVSHGSPGHPGVQRAERGVDPAARRARPGAHVRPDGRHQHGARRVHHGRRLHRVRHADQILGSAGLSLLVSLPVAFVVAGLLGLLLEATLHPPHVPPAARHAAGHLGRRAGAAAAGPRRLRRRRTSTCRAPAWLSGRVEVLGVRLPHSAAVHPGAVDRCAFAALAAGAASSPRSAAASGPSVQNRRPGRERRHLHPRDGPAHVLHRLRAGRASPASR